MKITGIKFNTIKNFFRKLPRILGEKAFLSFLTLLFLAIIFSGLVFYKYSVLIQNKKLDIPQDEKPIQFKEKTYQDVLTIWQEKEERFQETETKIYPNSFQTTTSSPEESISVP